VGSMDRPVGADGPSAPHFFDSSSTLFKVKVAIEVISGPSGHRPRTIASAQKGGSLPKT
jgi:hypothetical protein